MTVDKTNTTDKLDTTSKPRYINPFTDFGFKTLFGEEPNKDLLLDFLNELLKDEQGSIKEINYLKNEKLGPSQVDRRATFDLYCTNERGEKFIVELQKTEQKYFKDRALYYSTFPITEQAKKGEWNYKLKAVYMIAILDFVFDKDEGEPEKYRYDVKLTDIETGKVFYDKLKFIYLEMPKFTKVLEKLSNRFEKWMYVLRHLSTLERIPEALQEKIFKKLFEVAEVAKLSPEQAQSYRDSLKYYQDIKNSIDTATEKGREEGIKEGIQQGIQQGVQQGIQQGIESRNIAIAKNMLKKGSDTDFIQEVTGLSKEDIKKLK
jgi:predicted transposase/invertase (TIGR01784 family)